ncbi:MAG TPA: hypothetical protein PK566_16915 [Pseudobacteroides sp.]|nr:hypothetical protein [Pseudobacteroides sp.]
MKYGNKIPHKNVVMVEIFDFPKKANGCIMLVNKTIIGMYSI